MVILKFRIQNILSIKITISVREQDRGLCPWEWIFSDDEIQDLWRVIDDIQCVDEDHIS